MKVGQTGWVVHVGISRAICWRVLHNVKSYLTTISAVCTVMPQEQVDTVAGDSIGATALLKRRLPVPQLCGDKVEFQENGPMWAVSSTHPVPKQSVMFACTVRESNTPTRVATTKYGFIFTTINRCYFPNILFLKGRAAKQGRQSFGIHMVFRETFFCKSTCIFISSLSSRIESMEYNN